MTASRVVSSRTGPATPVCVSADCGAATASPAARLGEVSALYRIWLQSILKLRGLPNFQRNCFRLAGGNQRMTDAFAARLGLRVRLGCPISAIEHGDSGVTVEFQEFGEPRKLEADYLVSSHSHRNPGQDSDQARLARVEGLRAASNVVFGSQSRVLLQSRTRFWQGELPSINLDTGEAAMYLVYQTADEVPGERAILMGSGKADATAAEALSAFTRVYPGKSHTVETAYVHNWSQGSLGAQLRAAPLQAGHVEKILAADDRAGRADPLRRLSRR